MVEPKDAKAIKDLKPGDDWTGKIGAKEYTVDDGKVTVSKVDVVIDTMTTEQLARRKEQLAGDIAYRESTLAEINACIAKLAE